MNVTPIRALPGLIFTLSQLLMASPALSESVSISDLGALELQYHRIDGGEGFTGPAMAAEVTYQPGEAVSLVTPARVQKITYLATPGQRVEAGDIIAKLSGPEVHHLLTEYEVVKQRFQNAEQRFKRNKTLYETQAIDEARWLEISDAYFELQLEYEHLHHFVELLQPGRDESEDIGLITPADGLLQYHQMQPGIASGEELALILPENAVKLRVAVPIGSREGLVQLQVNDHCTPSIESISSIADGFFLRAWSSPLSQECELLIGQQLMVYPIYRIAGYELPGQAIVQWEGEPAILIRQGGNLVPTPVNILASTANGYYISSESDLTGADVLRTSASAVQGILLGLGGE